MTRVTLLTDFGTADGYAAAMAGVIAAAAPDGAIEHASHDIPQGDIAAAALTLSRYADRYPSGTVHLIVVDPGVGTDRRALAATLDGRHFVAPDNGVLTLVLRAAAVVEVVEIRDPERMATASATFHGRDLFAPAAAALARGETLASLGPPVEDPVLLPWPEPERLPDGAAGVVLHVDRFGTLISNVPEAWIRGRDGTVRVGDRVIGPVRRTYADVGVDEPVALIGSLGLLEVSVRNGSAADRFGAGRGARVSFREAVGG